MKKASIVAAVIVFAIALGSIRTMLWWRQETAKGHHLSIAPPGAWGFYKLQGTTTLAAYPPGELDFNRVTDVRQYGPITDSIEHPAYMTGK